MKDKSTLKNLLLELEQQLLDVETRTDPIELNKLLADDFFEFGSSGKISCKRDSVSGDGLTVRKMTLSNFEIYPLSDESVLATYLIKDETRKVNTLRSSIWKLVDGRWQMFFHQGTITNQ